MSWSTIASAEVLNEFTPAEQAALNNIQATQPTASSALDTILNSTVQAARGAIIAGQNALDLPNTIPDQIRQDVIAIARWKWLNSFPALKALQTKGREKAHDDGQATLKAIAARDIKVEPAPNATGGSVAFQASRRKATAHKLSGLI